MFNPCRAHHKTPARSLSLPTPGSPRVSTLYRSRTSPNMWGKAGGICSPGVLPSSAIRANRHRRGGRVDAEAAGAAMSATKRPVHPVANARSPALRRLPCSAGSSAPYTRSTR
jgi:hypothetical protein